MSVSRIRRGRCNNKLNGIAPSQSFLELTVGFKSLRHDDLVICGAKPFGVEEHEVTTRGAFNPQGKGQITVALLRRGVVVDAWGKAAIDQEHGQMACAERVRQAAYGTGLQPKQLERLHDLGHETLTPSHAPSYLRQITRWPCRVIRARLHEVACAP